MITFTQVIKSAYSVTSPQRHTTRVKAVSRTVVVLSLGHHKIDAVHLLSGDDAIYWCRQLSDRAAPTWRRLPTAESSTTCRRTRRCMRMWRAMTVITSAPAARSNTSAARASCGAPPYLSVCRVRSTRVNTCRLPTH